MRLRSAVSPTLPRGHVPSADHKRLLARLIHEDNNKVPSIVRAPRGCVQVLASNFATEDSVKAGPVTKNLFCLLLFDVMFLGQFLENFEAR